MDRSLAAKFRQKFAYVTESLGSSFAAQSVNYSTGLKAHP